MQPPYAPEVCRPVVFALSRRQGAGRRCSCYLSPRSSMYLTTSPTVWSFSASSSGISAPNSSSKARTNSTVSRESAPKFSMNFASGVTWSGFTPSCSTIISFTRSAMDFSAMGSSCFKSFVCLCENCLCCQSLVCANASLHRQATVHRDDLPGHIRRQVTREEQDHIGHVLGCPQPPQRNPRLQHLARRFPQCARHFGHNEARRHG